MQYLKIMKYAILIYGDLKGKIHVFHAILHKF